MITHMRIIIASAMLALGLASCVHEWPNDVAPPTPPPATLREFRLILQHETALPLLGEYIYDSGSIAPSASSRALGPDEAAKPHHIRYVINAYPASRGEASRASDTTLVFTRAIADGLDTTLKFDLPKGDYRLIVWTDYVDDGSTADKYYDTSDFNEIILRDRNKHYGSNQWRDAFYGSVDTSISRADPDGAIIKEDLGEATVPMARPMAKYTFVSTDLRRFLGYVTQQSTPVSESSASKTTTVNLDDYKVKFIYTRYMPCSFNAHTGKPADSWLGMNYESKIKQLSDDEAEIGFDYVFVNGDRTAVTVGMEVMDRDGNLLARIPAFDVPLERSKHTIVKGEFLTTKAGGSMGINPDFDGDFNIEIK